ncbi:Hypothetical protein CGLY_16610 (plasmid) [Corynebacterium glyciniphilum AJ 3170]|uniref:Uncharacterized protein n=1 Tax=Corynebacterium glyciniphilum AJ 3170 TaxID=1404245 RepID=X5EE77_9CORY|nr:hypothetical protein [Corynebacterium glyciniphilum]AHW65695.1 Hypothetical protein CGLY_16610 [Corynebacterium glyciniphilum AJ 3170]
MALAELLDRSRGFVLDSQLGEDECRAAVCAGDLQVHDVLGDVTVYRAVNVDAELQVEDYWPTVMALSPTAFPEPGTSPGFILADATALSIRDCGVLLPENIQVLVDPDHLASVSTVPGTSVTTGLFVDTDWSWEYGIPVMTALCAIRRLADNPGVEPAWLAEAIGDAYDNRLASADALAAAVYQRALSWGYRDGYTLIDSLAPGIVATTTAV